MPSKPVITEASLTSLGPKRLADLVIDAKVRMMVAAMAGGDALDTQLDARIKGLAGMRTFYDWKIAGDFVRTLDTIRASIVEERGCAN